MLLWASLNGTLGRPIRCGSSRVPSTVPHFHQSCFTSVPMNCSGGGGIKGSQTGFLSQVETFKQLFGIGRFCLLLLHSPFRMDFQMFALVLMFLACVEQGLAASCVVDSFTVKEDFEPARYAGKWYALQKKDPEGLFLQDNIMAEYTIGDDGAMVASSRGRVTLFGFWVVCADMAAQYTVPDPTAPGKMFMNYQGLASYLSSGGDNYWVIDTDYDNYAITYACRTLKDDGSCDDGYSLIFSRNPRGLPPAIQRQIRQKQEEICMAGEFQPVLQSGACP